VHLKYSEIQPLFKKDDKNNIPNYRPVPLLTLFSKIFERIIHVRIYKHINNNSTLSIEYYMCWREIRQQKLRHIN
jgi:hypothetical protein